MLTWKSAADSDAGVKNTESAAHAKRFAADTAMEVSTDASPSVWRVWLFRGISRGPSHESSKGHANL